MEKFEKNRMYEVDLAFLFAFLDFLKMFIRKKWIIGVFYGSGYSRRGEEYSVLCLRVELGLERRETRRFSFVIGVDADERRKFEYSLERQGRFYAK